MSISSEIAAIVRVLNWVSKVGFTNQRKEFLSNLRARLTPEQKQELTKIIRSMILMTSGSVKTIRNPELYSKPDHGWLELGSRAATDILREIDPQYRRGFTWEPSKEDYKTANALLPLMGSMVTNREDVLRQAGAFRHAVGGDHPIHSEGAETLYRGIKGLSRNVMTFVTSLPLQQWDIQRSVSTSYDKKESASFAGISFDSKRPDVFYWEPSAGGMGNGPSIFFTIKNPKKRGFPADNMSHYSGESEFILSGMLQINSYRLDMEADIAPLDFDANQNDQTYRGYLEAFSNERKIVIEDENEMPIYNFVFDNDAEYSDIMKSLFSGNKTQMPEDQIGKVRHLFANIQRTIVFVDATVIEDEEK